MRGGGYTYLGNAAPAPRTHTLDHRLSILSQSLVSPVLTELESVPSWRFSPLPIVPHDQPTEQMGKLKPGQVAWFACESQVCFLATGGPTAWFLSYCAGASRMACYHSPLSSFLFPLMCLPVVQPQKKGGPGHIHFTLHGITAGVAGGHGRMQLQLLEKGPGLQGTWRFYFK